MDPFVVLVLQICLYLGRSEFGDNPSRFVRPFGGVELALTVSNDLLRRRKRRNIGDLLRRRKRRNIAYYR